MITWPESGLMPGIQEYTFLHKIHWLGGIKCKYRRAAHTQSSLCHHHGLLSLNPFTPYEFHSSTTAT